MAKNRTPQVGDTGMCINNRIVVTRIAKNGNIIIQTTEFPKQEWILQEAKDCPAMWWARAYNKRQESITDPSLYHGATYNIFFDYLQDVIAERQTLEDAVEDEIEALQENLRTRLEEMA